ncbi:MAG: hypothetical protein ACI82H_001804 [Alphaproteobacteria bacterium]|jgi:hypothetical protein
MEITPQGDRISVTLSLTIAEFTQALADGELRVALNGDALGNKTGAAVGLAPEATAIAAAIVQVCGAYGPESLGANLLWEVAQAGEDGINASALKDLLGIETSKQLAGVFSGLGKVLAREMPGGTGHKGAGFIIKHWQGAHQEFHYRMTAGVREQVLKALG